MELFLVRVHLHRECEGCVHPWYIGRAYYCPEIRATVEAIIPLNWIIGWGRWLWSALVYGPRLSKWDAKIERSYWDGYYAGWEEALEVGRCRERERQRAEDARLGQRLRAYTDVVRSQSNLDEIRAIVEDTSLSAPEQFRLILRFILNKTQQIELDG